MQQTPVRASVTGHRDTTRRRAVLALAASAGLALGVTACGGAAGPAPSASAAHGNISAGAGPRAPASSGTEDSGTFSAAFARCMRAHGVPDFPDPDGQAGQLGPSSGIDPSSPQFQAALNGPCESLAPPAWVGSGKVSR